MIRDILLNLVRFVFLVLLQGIIVNNLQLNYGLIVPMIYPLFILMLPLLTPGWMVLLLSLAMGFTVDTFTNTFGLHASASLLMGYARYFVLKFISPREGYDPYQKPTLQSMGNRWYVSYVLPLILIHHFWIFNMENFQFDFFFRIQFRVIFSAAFSLLLIYLSQYLLYKVREKR